MNSTQHQEPVVLVHGIFGFDRLSVGGLELASYFRRIPAALRQDGHTVPPPPQLNLAGRIQDRALDLKNYLNSPELSGKKVHLIAHSMGGLDARWMIARLGMAGRVLSLTTIGTPHHGSPIADLLLSSVPGLTEAAGRLGMDVNGVADLATDACRAFNANTPESPEVRYFAVAGRFEPSPPTLLGLTHGLIAEQEGPNDGLVSVESASFGQKAENWRFLETWEANHFRQINWGENLAPNAAELSDTTIINRYRALVVLVKRAVDAWRGR